VSAFFVGQRVRLKYLRAPEWNELAGREGRVVAIGNFPPDDYQKHYATHEVAIDGCPINGRFIAEQLEPILPSGHHPAELTVEELLPFLNERAQA